MISSRVSRLTLNGMFFMTIAVGIISSSLPTGVPELTGGACIWLMGGDPPDEERSELFGGERERLSGIPAPLSSHCWAWQQKVSYGGIAGACAGSECLRKAGRHGRPCS